MDFQGVVAILDESIGGPGVGIGSHQAFWRDISRDEFVAKKVIGKKLIVIGDGANSNLVRALKGEIPFGSDLPDAPPEATTRRMPAGRQPVPAESIAAIEQWINDGCPEKPAVQPAVWRETNAPAATSRTDDIWFIDSQRGWAVNSDGQILHTEDGFATFQEQFHDEDSGLYLRSVGFASATRGWVGTTTPGRQLLQTADGGATWTEVADLPDLAPPFVCGLSVVSESVVYASGTNDPGMPVRVMRTIDGGATWQANDMSDHATILIDIYFTDTDTGWVVGGKAALPTPPIPHDPRSHIKPVALHTTDGGQTWTNTVEGLTDQLPLGEWGWKIHFIDDHVGFISLENFSQAAILKTVDGGQTWNRIEVQDPQGNVNLEGIGFLDENTGWVGGWGSTDFRKGFSSATTDSGETWKDANEIGRFINRFRFFRDIPLGYASGKSVYKYSTEPVPPAIAGVAELRPHLLADNEPTASALPLPVTVDVPPDAGRLIVCIWDHFAKHVRRLIDEAGPAAGARTLEWDGHDDDGRTLPAGDYLIRVTVDGSSESRIVYVTG
ncbi:YCF48-related protein [Mycolicibacterium setense]